MSQLQAIREAQFTEEEALEWAESYYREYQFWPRRRFRVEGGPAGNSRLLTKSAALTAKYRYGGTIVQLICEARYYRDVCEQQGRECVMKP